VEASSGDLKTTAVRAFLRSVALAALLLLLAGQGAAASPESWESVLDRVVPSVIAIRVSATRPFDTGIASDSGATGFVVDAEQGLVLTNRHVVQPGPVRADALFLNHEKVELRPIYRDPVHDFGFYRFDPSEVRFMEPGELPLAPEGAHVGAEVRVIGNDAGEKLSILAGTIARLDREAPRYGSDRYNDFNTFYLQAASSASGGSSGSPVIDRRGRVVGLNAGGTQSAASSFFLPLDRVVRALDLIRAGRPVTRGTIQAVFRYESYDELRRLGLRAETEASVREALPDAIGMLVVAETVPGGAAHGLLESGDILLGVQGRRINAFADLEAILDDSVGDPVAIRVERGGALVEVSLTVEDLHAITPATYLELGGAILHPLSYQQARNHAVPAGGVYLVWRGYSFGRAGVPSRVVITEVDGEPVKDLDEFERLVAARADGTRVLVRYFSVFAPRSSAVAVVTLDRRWFPMRRCDRDDSVGLWVCRPAEDPPDAEPWPPASTGIAVDGSRPARALAPSLAMVEFDVPFRIDGVLGTAFAGAGLVVDAEAGLMVVDRDTVPVSLGDVRITFGGSVEVPGRVVLLHPDHNLAVISYDPSLIGDTPVRSAELRPRSLAAGDEVWLVALTRGQQVVSRKSPVARVDAASIPLPSSPRFREFNAELISLTETIASVGGVLADGKGRVLAIWASFSTTRVGGKPDAFFAGISAELIEDLVAPLRAGQPFVWRSLGAEFETMTLAAARARGLDAEAARRLEKHDPRRRRALMVKRLTAGSPAAELLRVGDLILAADDQPVTAFRELEEVAQNGETLLTVLRNGVVQSLTVPAVPISDGGTDRALMWSGALLQTPPREVAQQRGLAPEGVYVADTLRGSPSERDGLRRTQRITAVDGRPTPDLDAFLSVAVEKEDGESVRLRIESLDGKVRVVTLETDLHYWPTQELRRAAEGWVRQQL
jgi:S1-C subfamily serine protease